MGQKVNPNGLRLGINKTWSSRWYSKTDYAKLLHEDLEIKKYVQEKLVSASISKVIIERAAKKLRLTIYSSRPGIIIGKKGADIEHLKNNTIDGIQILRAKNPYDVHSDWIVQDNQIPIADPKTMKYKEVEIIGDTKL